MLHKDPMTCAVQSRWKLSLCVSVTLSAAAGFLAGGSVERRCDEEEAGWTPGEHDKPRELIQQNMDSKALPLFTCIE